METRRGLLTLGNQKLSASIYHFDLPAVSTCPGRTHCCSSACYATIGRFAFPAVRRRLAWNFAQAKRPDFAVRMMDEIYRKGCLVVRWHVSGDIFSPGYACKILEVVACLPKTRFFCYTRSWRVAKILPVLRMLARMDNMRLWFSADKDAYPRHVPPGVRVAYMQTAVGDEPATADLVFRVQRLRRRIELPTVAPVCPVETPEGKQRGTTCATCAVCWE